MGCEKPETAGVGPRCVGRYFESNTRYNAPMICLRCMTSYLTNDPKSTNSCFRQTFCTVYMYIYIYIDIHYFQHFAQLCPADSVGFPSKVTWVLTSFDASRSWSETSQALRFWMKQLPTMWRGAANFLPTFQLGRARSEICFDISRLVETCWNQHQKHGIFALFGFLCHAKKWDDGIL